MEQICFLHAYLGLDFRPVARPKPPTTGLSALVSVSHRSLRDLFCVFLRHYVLSAHRHGLERRLVQAPGARNKLIYYTSIRQREHKKCCQLYFEARLTSIASLLGVLTQPFYLLSKPDSPSLALALRVTRGSTARLRLRAMLRFFGLQNKF